MSHIMGVHKRWLKRLKPGSTVALKYDLHGTTDNYLQKVHRVTKNFLFIKSYGRFSRQDGVFAPHTLRFGPPMMISIPTLKDKLVHARFECDDLIDNLILEVDEIGGITTINVGDLSTDTMMRLRDVLTVVKRELKAKKVKLRYP